MTQADSWIIQYTEILRFIIKNKKKPSKHRIEEHKMLNWLKYNKKQQNSGRLPEDRAILFNHLLEVAERYRRLNQYAYRSSSEPLVSS